MEHPDLVGDYLARSHDHLDRLEQNLVGLEREPTSTLLLNRVTGALRSLAEGATALDLRRLPTLTDGAEALLTQVFRGRVAISGDVVDALLTCADAIRGVLDELAATGGEGEGDISSTLGMLDALAVSAEPAPVAPLGEVLTQSGLVTPTAVSLARHAQELGDPRPLGEILLTQGSLSIAQLAAGLDRQSEKRSILDGAVRVDADVLHELHRRSAELGDGRDLLRAALLAESAGPLTSAAAARLSALIEATQEAIRETRLRRLDDVWMCLPRVIRDAAATAGKVATLATEGGALRFDRVTLATLRDPLILLARNAVEHGIEPSPVRQAVGKPAAGVVRLTAVVSGDVLVVEVSDDGVGIDPMRVRSLALRLGLSSAYELARLSDAAALQLMLLPGLSTDSEGGSAAWTPPGTPRGFGLALATVALEAAGGTLDIGSDLGVGTTVRLILPVIARETATITG